MKALYVQVEDEQYDKLKDLAIKKSVKGRRKVALAEVVRDMIENYKGEKEYDVDK